MFLTRLQKTADENWWPIPDPIHNTTENLTSIKALYITANTKGVYSF